MTTVPDHEFPLDPMEQAAAEDAANVVLALGGSGTGRTHTLAARDRVSAAAGRLPGQHRLPVPHGGRSGGPAPPPEDAP